jgi:hypothetical protein
MLESLFVVCNTLEKSYSLWAKRALHDHNAFMSRGKCLKTVLQVLRCYTTPRPRMNSALVPSRHVTRA